MKPFFSVFFNVRMCHMKVSINGIPLLNMEVSGQCSSRYPFNNLLLESGWASVRYEILPLEGEMQLRKDAYFSCKIELYNLDSGFEPISTMASYEMHINAILPYAVYKDNFRIYVPYNLTGWKYSAKLDQFQDKLRPMVFKKYDSIISMMNNHNFDEYENAFREREDIICSCFYLSENERRERMKEVKNAIENSSIVVPLSILDKLEFAAEGRLVRLIKKDGESALRLWNDKTGEETMLDMWLHMKLGNTNLTII